MPITQFLMASAIVPSLMLVWYFRARDVYPEPAGVLWKTFFLGVLTVIPVLIVALPLASMIKGVGDPIVAGFLSAFLTAAGPEEFFKFVVVAGYCARHKEFDEPMDGVVYGAVASLGFATLENILYVSSGGLAVAIMRAILAVPCHAFMGAIMGYFVGQAKFRPAEKGKLLALGYFVPFLLHGLYDWPLLASKSAAEAASAGNGDPSNMVLWLLPVTFAAFIFEWVWTVRIIRRLRREQLASAGAQAALAPAGYPPAPQAQPYPQPTYGNPYSVAPQWGAYPTPPTSASPVLGIFAIILGVVIAAIGGMMTLGAAMLAIAPSNAQLDGGSLFVAAVLFGLLPLGLGIASFVYGIKKLNGR
jgi:RsiW-degrading membrane proteinase PrsW (M82 family)